jgi:hypothetical protein
VVHTEEVEQRRAFGNCRLLTSPESLEWLAHDCHCGLDEAIAQFGGDPAALFAEVVRKPVDAGKPLSAPPDLMRPEVITLDGEETDVIRVFHWPGPF